jgi:uncharacterized Ntn-hydrolase superfamily protein
VGVIDIKGRSAQWTGKNQYGAEKQGDWVHMRRGATFAAQGNSLVSPKVVDAVADTFQASEGSVRTLADRLIEALNAGHQLGGDGRHGERSPLPSSWRIRPGMSRRPDGITVNINVCEHPRPVAELRRIYDTASETLGFRRSSSSRGVTCWPEICCARWAAPPGRKETRHWPGANSRRSGGGARPVPGPSGARRSAAWTRV